MGGEPLREAATRSNGRLRQGQFAIGRFFRQLQKNVFERAVQSSLPAQGVERAAADEPAAVYDADASGQFLRNVERMRGQKDGRAGGGFLAQQVLQEPHA